MIEKHKEEIRQLQQTAAEQMDVMKAALAEEKDRAVKQARMEYASAADSLTENEKLLWRQREQHLREEFEDQMSAVRTRYTNELDEERKRATESIRDMQQKHFSDVQTLQAEFQSRIAAVLDGQTRERQEWMRKANEEHAAWKQVSILHNAAKYTHCVCGNAIFLALLLCRRLKKIERSTLTG